VESLVHGEEPRFDTPCVINFELIRPTMTSPLYVGICPRAQDELGGDDHPGAAVALSGWSPGLGIDHPARFLYVRGS
jgi:hypothetical protein